MLPSYVIPAPLDLVKQDCITLWFSLFMVIITFSLFFNLITLNILNRVASVKQMDSYQEVAYNISNSNRGYIFLISAAKFIFLAITAAFAIDYCASYLTTISLLGRSVAPACTNPKDPCFDTDSPYAKDFDMQCKWEITDSHYLAGCDPTDTDYSADMSAGQIYGIYFAWVFGIGLAMFFPYNFLRQEKSEQGRTKLVFYAMVFGGCFLAQFLVILFTVVAAVTHSNDQDIVDSFLYS